jgi:hypothetical protein
MKSEFALTAVLAFCASAPASSVWLEDFDAGIPASWTIIDNSIGGDAPWASNVVWNEGNYTDPAGINTTPCAEANSDVPGEGVVVDTALISPSFLVPNGATLDFDANYQSWSDADLADTDISIDGGSTWINLLHWIPPEAEQGTWRGTGAHISTDISAYAGQDAQVRFHYYNANWEWYFQVDNVQVTPEPGSLMLFGLGALATVRRR